MTSLPRVGVSGRAFLQVGSNLVGLHGAVATCDDAPTTIYSHGCLSILNEAVFLSCTARTVISDWILHWQRSLSRFLPIQIQHYHKPPSPRLRSLCGQIPKLRQRTWKPISYTSSSFPTQHRASSARTRLRFLARIQNPSTYGACKKKKKKRGAARFHARVIKVDSRVGAARKFPRGGGDPGPDRRLVLLAFVLTSHQSLHLKCVFDPSPSLSRHLNRASPIRPRLYRILPRRGCRRRYATCRHRRRGRRGGFT